MNQNDPVPDDFTLSPAFVDALPALFFCLQHGTGGRNFAFGSGSGSGLYCKSEKERYKMYRVSVRGLLF